MSDFMTERRTGVRCSCGSNLTHYYLRLFPGASQSVLYMFCGVCKSDNPARRQADIDAFKQIAQDFNGEA